MWIFEQRLGLSRAVSTHRADEHTFWESLSSDAFPADVVIQGDMGSDAQLFGVHTGAFNGGVMRLENVELRNCGQGFSNGRYCTQLVGRGRSCGRGVSVVTLLLFALQSQVGDASASYVRSNSIHHSYNRAVAIAGSDQAAISRNFVYSVAGHAMFVSDGREQGNTFEENLVVSTVASSAGLGSDATPAAFWSASPTNLWRHNRVVSCSLMCPSIFPHGNPCLACFRAALQVTASGSSRPHTPAAQATTPRIAPWRCL